MSVSLIALFLSVSVLPTAVVPGESLGIFKLGISEAELAKVGPKVTPGRVPGERTVGAFRVLIEAGRVVRVSLDIDQDPLLVGDAVLTRPSALGLAAALGDCGPLEARRGGNIIECASGARIAQHRGGVTVSVVPPSTVTTKATCAAYLEPGDPNAKIVLEAGKDYCVPSRVVTRKTAQADVLGALRYDTCRTAPSEGATVVTCAFHGLRFVFAAPSGELARVEGVPLQKN